MNIIDFRLLTRDDIYDKKYDAWSRIYEYPIVLNIIQEYIKNNNLDNNNISIHNTCWGWGGCHCEFYNDLNKISDKVVHSDIKKSHYDKTQIYDVTKEPEKEHINNFDIVLNISTFEEIRNFSHVDVLKNLLDMVKNKGLCIITFDLNLYDGYENSNSIDLNNIEKFISRKLDININNKISGVNSEKIEKRNEKLNCGLLVIEKII